MDSKQKVTHSSDSRPRSGRQQPLLPAGRRLYSFSNGILLQEFRDLYLTKLTAAGGSRPDSGGGSRCSTPAAITTKRLLGMQDDFCNLSHRVWRFQARQRRRQPLQRAGRRLPQLLPAVSQQPCSKVIVVSGRKSCCSTASLSSSSIMEFKLSR